MLDPAFQEEIMNHKNLNQLIDWLDRGAPEALFSMNIGLRAPDEVVDSFGDFEFELPQSELDKLHAKSCGSVCCIAGAAAQFGGAPIVNDFGWADIQERALAFLGLPNAHGHHMLPVFDPDLAPEACTPKQAAQALKLWATHADTNPAFNPWPQE